jgi:restriction endonuclease S subunit
MRRKLIEADLIECVLGLGPNLFYNSPMEACVVICRTSKPKARKGKILLINAVDEVTRERAQSFLTDEHIKRIVAIYRALRDESGFAKVATIANARARNYSLAIPLYVETATGNAENGSVPINEAFGSWLKSREQVQTALTGVSLNLPLPENAARVASAMRCELLRDRAGWTRVRFGDVVGNVNETENDPGSANLQRFIGLEHLEPGSLRVRTWGDVADGTTFTRRCRPGQVLFGKRRAYQRKVAVAEFDAVVSGDIYVLRPHTERLLPELLPFVCLSERFFQHAVGTSAGSLSPRTNWSSLASFQFELPPLDQQARIAEILWAMDGALQAWRFARLQHAQSLYAFASVATSVGLSANGCQSSRRAALPASWVSCRIEELTIDSAYGRRFPGSQYTPDGNVRTIRTTDFDRQGGISFDDVPAAKLDEETVRLHQLRSEDFLLSRSGEYAGLTAVFSDPADSNLYIPAAFLIRYRFDERLDPRFLLALCNSSFGDDFVKPLATGSAQPNIAGSAFGHLRIPVPPIGEQKSVVEAISRLRQAGNDIVNHEARLRDLFGALLSGLT